MKSASDWKGVSEFPSLPKAEDPAFHQFDEWLQKAGVDARRLSGGPEARALVVPLTSLLQATGPGAKGAAGESAELRPHASDELTPLGDLLIVAATTTAPSVEALWPALREGIGGAGRPEWIALPAKADARALLLDAGIDLPPASATLELPAPPDGPISFHLHRLPTLQDHAEPVAADLPPIGPSGLRIAEGPEYLRGRADWFTRRTGGPK